MLRAVLGAAVVTGLALFCVALAAETKAAELQQADESRSGNEQEPSRMVEIPVGGGVHLVETFHGVPIATEYYC